MAQAAPQIRTETATLHNASTAHENLSSMRFTRCNSVDWNFGRAQHTKLTCVLHRPAPKLGKSRTGWTNDQMGGFSKECSLKMVAVRSFALKHQPKGGSTILGGCGNRLKGCCPGTGPPKPLPHVAAGIAPCHKLLPNPRAENRCDIMVALKKHKATWRRRGSILVEDFALGTSKCL